MMKNEIHKNGINIDVIADIFPLLPKELKMKLI